MNLSDKCCLSHLIVIMYYEVNKLVNSWVPVARASKLCLLKVSFTEKNMIGLFMSVIVKNKIFYNPTIMILKSFFFSKR